MPFDMQRMSIIQAIHNHTKSSYTQIKQISTITAVPLTVRDINRGGHPSTTITRMDAGVEPPRMVSRRVVGGCTQFMSRIKIN